MSVLLGYKTRGCRLYRHCEHVVEKIIEKKIDINVDHLIIEVQQRKVLYDTEHRLYREDE